MTRESSSRPRYSIIPGGAVTDRQLEPRDLQVLCLLGRHTDKLGWCFRSQVEMAEELDCGRATLQRSLARLQEAGWVEVRDRKRHSYYAYRVVMDRDDEKIGPSEYQVEAQLIEQGAHQRAPMPVQSGQGGAHTYVGIERPSEEESSSGGIAREPLITQEAISTAEIIATIAGYPDPKAWPPGWCGAPMRVEAFLREGYHPQHMIAAATEVMAGNPNAKAWTIGYFEKAFARAKARQEAPLPKAEITGVSNGRAETVRNGFVGRIAPRANRSRGTFKEERWSDAFENVDRGLGIAGADEPGGGEQISAAAAGRLPKLGSA